jgi:hypothetical protein
MKKIVIELDASDAEIIIQILKIAPLQGNLQTLPAMLSMLVAIQEKLVNGLKDVPGEMNDKQD